MAGVGFSLRNLRHEDSYRSVARLWGSAAVISSGPWLISILSLLLIGVLSERLGPMGAAMERFQVAVTWLFAISLLLTTPFQLVFTRFISDLMYAEKDDQTVANLWGALALTSVLTAAIGLASWPLFQDCSLLMRVLLMSTLVVLANIWIVIVVLTGLKEHGKVLTAFTLGYLSTSFGCVALSRFGEEGLMAGFLLGQSVLLWWSTRVVVGKLPSAAPVAWDFLKRANIRGNLFAVGLFYGAGTWIDKLMFWFYRPTSRAVLGPFRASEVYDLPLFLAYLAIAPGMAAFLLRVETDYAERHTTFFREVEEGATLTRIEALRDALALAARAALVSIFKVQGVTFVLCAIYGASLLRLFGISTLHGPLFMVDAAGVSLQVVVLSILSIFFYLDRREIVLWLAALLFVLNTGATALSLWLGPAFYGFGFAFATAATALMAIVKLRDAFQDLVRDTFMQQGVGL